jgi:hypothetical protein
MTELLPIRILLEQRLLDWSSLAVGWDRGWVSPEDVDQFATSWLTAHPADDDVSIALLADARSLSEEEIRERLFQVAQRREQFDVADEKQHRFQVDKWRYAHLLSLQRAQLPDAEKIDRLQIMYAHFGYPKDMAGCSIYGLGPDPLEAMRSVIEKLRSTGKGKRGHS